MYKVIIELKKDVSDENVKQLKEIIESAFDNGIGRVSPKETGLSYLFEFVGGEDKFNCMQFGLVISKKEKLFWNNVSVWKWIDEEDPDECCDVKEVFSIPVR